MTDKKIIINITIISSNIPFIKAVFADCIESMANSLRQLGCTTYITENTLVEEIVNIVWGIGTHYSKEYDLYRNMTNNYKVIFMNMEQLGGGSALLDSEYYHLLANNKYFDYCFKNINHLRTISGLKLNAQEFPLLPISVENIARESINEYDFAFFGAMNYRREKILKEFTNNGYSIKVISGKYGNDLSNELLECKALLNVHYYETSLFEVARCIRPISMHMPILSEISYMPELVNWASAGIVFSEYSQLLQSAHEFMNPWNLKKMSVTSELFVQKVNPIKFDMNMLIYW